MTEDISWVEPLPYYLGAFELKSLHQVLQARHPHAVIKFNFIDRFLQLFVGLGFYVYNIIYNKFILTNIVIFYIIYFFNINNYINKNK